MPGSSSDYTFISGTTSNFTGTPPHVYGGATASNTDLSSFTMSAWNSALNLNIWGGDAPRYAQIYSPAGAQVQTAALLANANSLSANANLASFALGTNPNFNYNDFYAYVTYGTVPGDGGVRDTSLTATLGGLAGTTQLVTESPLTLVSAHFAEFHVTGAYPDDVLTIGAANVAAERPYIVGVSFSSVPVHATTAEQADHLVDSIGVNIHSYDPPPAKTVYGNYAQLKANLLSLGIRHVRDGLVDGTWTGFYSDFNDLAANGIHATVIAGIPQARLIPVASQMTNAIEAFEGPNEVNNNGWTVANAQSYQQTLWNTVKGDPTFSGRSVLAISLANGSTISSYGNSLGDLSAYMDYGNIHPYPGGWNPENTRSPTFDLNTSIADGRVVANTKPMIATETGYTTATNATTGAVTVTTDMQGVYLPRLLLFYFQKGMTRTYDYELYDDKPDSGLTNTEADYGLIENDGVTYKSAGYALKNLTSLLSDPGPSFTPGSLGYTVTSSDPSLRSQLFQKRNGQFFLAVWRAVSLWDSSNAYGQKKEITITPVNTTLQVTGTVSNITSYQNLDSQNMTVVNQGAVNSVTLPQDGRVVFFQISTH